MATKRKNKRHSKSRKLRKSRRQRGGIFNIFKNRCTDDDYFNRYEEYKKNCCNRYQIKSKLRKQRCKINPALYDEPIEPIKTKQTYPITMPLKQLQQENQPLTEEENDIKINKRSQLFEMLKEELWKSYEPSYSTIEGILNEGLNPNGSFTNNEGSESVDYLTSLFHTFTYNDPSLIYTTPEDIEKLKNYVKIANLFVSKGFRINNEIILNALFMKRYFLVWYISNKFPEAWSNFWREYNKNNYKKYLEEMQPKIDWLDNNLGSV
jgi:hypothetical protein